MKRGTRSRLASIAEAQRSCKRCKKCPLMIGPVVIGGAIDSTVMLIGQAPGVREGAAGRPFAWTAGKTLFRWFSHLGLSEEEFRARVYMTAVCRCFPGKNEKGGDRVPNPEEVVNCGRWLRREIELLQPELIIPVGRLAIAQFVDFATLDQVIGEEFAVGSATIVPLPHPSGASTWHRKEPGKRLLERALALIGGQPAFRELCDGMS